MIKRWLNEFLLHPAFVSLLLWIALLLLLPLSFSKFKVSVVQENYHGKRIIWNYYDLDNDRISERILVDLNDTLQTKIMIYKENKVLNQYNLRFQPWGIQVLEVGDYNGDGMQELYVNTLSDDSIFLHVIDPVKEQKILVSDRYIDSWKSAGNSTDKPELKSVGFMPVATSGQHDYVFIYTTGYSKYPRNIYRYSMADDSLYRSPVSAASPTTCVMADIQGDSLPELLLHVAAPGNFEKSFPYSDQYAWLMVLDQRLEYLFTPVRIGEYPARTQVIPLKTNGSTKLVVLLDYYGPRDLESSLGLYDLTGKLERRKALPDLENIHSWLLQSNDPHAGTFFLVKNRHTTIEELDGNFDVVHTLTFPAVEYGKPICCVDADLDGKKEYFFQGRGHESLVITQSDFRNALTWSYPRTPESPIITQVLQSNHIPLLYLQFSDHGITLRFKKNPLFFLRYPLYGILYLVLLGLVILIAGAQRYRLELKRDTELKMAAWQIKAIRNQIDPHFTLNILNAIGSLYATEDDRSKADYIFAKYARLIRQTVISSDQIVITLGEELEFIRNYIDLERFRCNNAFNYLIDLPEHIDLQIRIPRMLIFTFVENALKYGIRKNAAGGFLKILLEPSDHSCAIVVEDNGPGLSGTHNVTGTGKGLMIVNELIALYLKLEHKNITWHLGDISDAENRKQGTRARIVIHW